MRWPAAERQARKFVRRVMDRHMVAVGDIIQALPGSDTLETARKVYVPPSEVQELYESLVRLLGSDTVQRILNAVESEAADMFSANGTGIFPDEYGNTWNVGIEEANRKLATRAKYDVYGQTLFDDPTIVQQVWDADNRYKQKLLTEGYDLVRAKLTRDFLPEAMTVIADGLRADLPWDAIAKNIYREVGEGYLWQWQRLVRTEMVKAFDLSFTAQYEAYDVEFVKWSAVSGRCPVCDERATNNGGYYKLATAPWIPESTHPNCRCEKIPYWNLPAGVTLE